VSSRISSKDSFDEGVLGGGGKEVLLLVFMVLGLMGSNVSKDVKADDWGGGDRGAGDDIGGAVRDVDEGEVFDVVKDRPGKFGGLGDDGLKDMGGDVEGTWVIPSVVRALEDLENCGSGVCNVLLVNIIKGGPGGDGDVGKGGGGDDGGLGRVERHSILN